MRIAPIDHLGEDAHSDGKEPEAPPSSPGSASPGSALPPIPLLDVGRDFPMQTLLLEESRARALLDLALGGVPRSAVRVLDAISRRWLVRSGNAQLAEIDAIARYLDRPGAHFLSVNYEWGCTVHVGPSPDGRSARLTRALDWMTSGLGRFVMAAKVQAPAGPFVTLTWPGFTGVLQAMAPGRFSVALNQAPMRLLGGGIYPIDWIANRARVWRSADPRPAQLLRIVCETAVDYAAARRMLAEAPIAAPAIFSLAGLAPGDTCVIERTERRANVVDGPSTVGNHWQTPGWNGRPRGIDSRGRTRMLASLGPFELDPDFTWLVAPVLNRMTRLAMVADATLGRVVARGYENCRPVTQPLVLGS